MIQATSSSSNAISFGVVTIGRNEGDRLKRCLESLFAVAPFGTPVVYVDSGSTDGSTDMARQLGAQVLDLDMSLPFTMARGRNAGFEYLLEQHPDLQFVQFIDGDCQIIENWFDRALEELQKNERTAVVCGRRREQHPRNSIYNQLCDIEWNTPIGEAAACGGDAMMRVQAVQQVQGYNPTLIAGEEPDMCLRMRQQNWRIMRIDAEMTLHDAAMTRFNQWWQRTVRGGWAYAEGAAMHGRSPQRHWVRESRSIWAWSVGLPLLAIVPAYWTAGLSLLLLFGFALLGIKVFLYRRRRGDRSSIAWQYAFFCVLAKWPMALGQVRYWLNRLRGKPAQLIEYKKPEPKTDNL